MSSYWGGQQVDDGANGQGHHQLQEQHPAPPRNGPAAAELPGANQSQPVASTSNPPGPIQPLIKVACLACRRLKIRCNKPDPNLQCTRCTKFNLDCEIKEHARGQKRNKADPNETESPTAPDSTSPKRKKRATISRESSPDSSNDVDSAPSNVLEDNTAISEPPPPSWSLNALLGLRKPVPQPQYSDQFPDAVSLGILTMSEAESIFEFFFDEMNPFLGIFDRALHTADYVRNTSSLLFTAILAVATRHRLREAHYACLRQVSDHLNTILSRDRKRPWLPTIQALCTLSFWKEANDDGGWRRVGFAIRLAYEDGLHRLSKTSLPSLDAKSSRLALDRHRTWLYLCCMDQMMSFQRDLPVMISPDSVSDAATFIHLTPNALSEDWWLAAALEYSNLRYQTRSARVFCMESFDRGQTSSADFFRYTARFDSLKSDFERWRQKWITDGSMFKNAVKSRLMLSFYASFMAFYISRTRTDVFSTFHERNKAMVYERTAHSNALLECYGDAIQVLSSLQQISAHKYALLYLPDTVPVGACAAAVWLLNATKQEPLRMRVVEVRDKLVSAAAACQNATLHRSDTPKRLARFFESITPVEVPITQPAYGNGTVSLPPQQQDHQQPMFQYGMQPTMGYGQQTGFDFSGMGHLFDNSLGNMFDPNLDLESFWNFYQTVDN